MRRPALTIASVLAVALAGGLLALGLRPSAGASTFVSGASSSYRATADDDRHFGADGVVVLIHESLGDLVETGDLTTVTELEACLAGQAVRADQQLHSFTPAPAGTPPYGGWGSPCGKLMRTRPAQVVYGPGTFLNQAVAAVNGGLRSLISRAQSDAQQAGAAADQLALAEHLSAGQALADANAAYRRSAQQETEQLLELYLQSGIQGTPSISDPRFVSQIVFDPTRGAGQPRARFAYLFPTASAALIQVRLKASLTYAEQSQAISWIRQAVRMPIFRSGHGGTYTVTGEPVVVSDLASAISGSVATLLIAAVLVMGAVLSIAWRRSGHLRLLPLATALAAVAITFGATSLAGASLTMASIAAVPVMIGLAVDYGIQLQASIDEGRRASAAAASSSAIATAALATAAGFAVLVLSPVPMVRGFGALLVLGIGVALVCALAVCPAATVLGDRATQADWLTGRRQRRATASIARLTRPLTEPLAASVRGAADILRDLRSAALRPLAPVRGPAARARPRLRSIARDALAAVARRPVHVLAVGALLAVLGWVADTQTPVQSDVTKLVPANMPALRDLRTLERVTGVSGEIDVTVQARDVTDPSVIRWMTAYQQVLLRHFGYLESRGCAQAALCPALSLPDLLSSARTGGSALTQAQIRALLAAVPAYFSQAVITPDHREAVLAFGIRLMALSRQQQVIGYMSSQLHPPSGTGAQLAGLPVLAAQANAALSSSGRRLLTLLAGLLAVAIVLALVLRHPRRALVPLVPIALATGWSALILFAIGIALNPMSATLGAMVIAISTEFSVLMSERFHRERAGGWDLTEAITRTYRSTGAAVLASGITAIAGFGVLVLSNIAMLRDFGFVTVVDLSVSLAGVLLALPAVLALAERADLAGSAREPVRRARARRWPAVRRLRSERAV